MENTIVAEVAIISDDDDDIDELNKKNRTESNLVIIHETSMQPRYSRKYWKWYKQSTTNTKTLLPGRSYNIKCLKIFLIEEEEDNKPTITDS